MLLPSTTITSCTSAGMADSTYGRFFASLNVGTTTLTRGGAGFPEPGGWGGAPTGIPGTEEGVPASAHGIVPVQAPRGGSRREGASFRVPGSRRSSMTSPAGSGSIGWVVAGVPNGVRRRPREVCVMTSSPWRSSEAVPGRSRAREERAGGRVTVGRRHVPRNPLVGPRARARRLPGVRKDPKSVRSHSRVVGNTDDRAPSAAGSQERPDGRHEGEAPWQRRGHHRPPARLVEGPFRSRSRGGGG